MTAPGTSRVLQLPSARQALHAALFVVGLMWLLPFLVPFKALPIPSFRAEAVAVALGLIALLSLPPWAARLAIPRVDPPAGRFCRAAVAPDRAGPARVRAARLLAALYLLWAAALMVLAALFRRELGLERIATVLAWYLFAGLIACSVIGFAQHLGSYAFLGRYITVAAKARVWGNLAQANHLADYMTLGLASLAYLYATGGCVWCTP